MLNFCKKNIKYEKILYNCVAGHVRVSIFSARKVFFLKIACLAGNINYKNRVTFYNYQKNTFNESVLIEYFLFPLNQNSD